MDYSVDKLNRFFQFFENSSLIKDNVPPPYVSNMLMDVRFCKRTLSFRQNIYRSVRLTEIKMMLCREIPTTIIIIVSVKDVPFRYPGFDVPWV